jgi:hypothetical protein
MTITRTVAIRWTAYQVKSARISLRFSSTSNQESFMMSIQAPEIALTRSQMVTVADLAPNLHAPATGRPPCERAQCRRSRRRSPQIGGMTDD